MILVIGATGTTGSAVARGLTERGLPTRALVRPRPSAPPPHGAPRGGHAPDLPGVEKILGDATDHDALRRALDGVQRVYLAMGNGPRQREIELAVVREAAAAGVEQLVKLSAPVVGPDVPVAIGRLHHEVEQAIDATDLGYAFLRPYAFMQNLLHQAPVIRQTGSFTGTTGDAPLNLVDARDIADVALTALTGPTNHRHVHVLTGPEAVSYPEIAGRLSRLGQSVRYIDLSPEELRRGMAGSGQPSWLIDHILEIQAMTVTVPEAPNSTVRDVTGHEPRALDAFLREVAGQFQPFPGQAETTRHTGRADHRGHAEPVPTI